MRIMEFISLVQLYTISYELHRISMWIFVRFLLLFCHYKLHFLQLGFYGFISSIFICVSLQQNGFLPNYNMTIQIGILYAIIKYFSVVIDLNVIFLLCLMNGGRQGYASFSQNKLIVLFQSSKYDLNTLNNKWFFVACKI